MALTPEFHGPFQPVYPCRVMPTRHCPAVYEAVCGGRPCARFEVGDQDQTATAAWMAEIDRAPGQR